MSKQRSKRLRAEMIGFAVFAFVVVLAAGLVAQWWTEGRETALPDGPVFQNGKLVGRAVGVKSVGKSEIHFAEISDADALLKSGKFQYGGSTLSINAIQNVRYAQSGGGVRLLRVVTRPDQPGGQ